VPSEPAKHVRKQILMWNSHSRSFKIMQFEITEKPTTDCISLYNNSGLISKVHEKIATKMLKIYRSWQRQPQSFEPHNRLITPPLGTSTNICKSLIPPETRVNGLLFCRLLYGSIFFQIFWWALKDAFFCNRVRIGCSSSSKVVDFGAI